jgi:hypothetical protein
MPDPVQDRPAQELRRRLLVGRCPECEAILPLDALLTDDELREMECQCLRCGRNGSADDFSLEED